MRSNSTTGASRAAHTRKPIPPKVRWSVYVRDGYRCRYCGQRPPDVALVLDHVIAVAHGGTDDPANLITSCEDCNAGKGTQRAPLHVAPEWPRLVALVPALGALLAEIAALDGGPGFCANAVWYGREGFRRRMNELVGAGAHHADPWVNSMEAHTIAYRTLWGALPDCDHEDRISCPVWR